MFEHSFTDYILLILSFASNFIIPGYVIIELFFKSNKILFKPPLYLLLSVLLSTNVIYISAVIFGLSDATIVVNYLFWFIAFVIVVLRTNFVKNVFNRKHLVAIISAVFVFIVFVFSLINAIFYKFDNYYVMSADNWQDTALHMSIIESIKEGNFPPQAPYFSGRELKYHYFTDLHTAILTYPLHKFDPKIISYDNSIFATIFFMVVYVLTLQITKDRKTSIFASVLATFSGSLLYLRFINDYINSVGSFKELILTGSYVLDYGKLYQMAPMTNYFLQNRPMMVGLSSVVLSIYFLFLYLENRQNIRYLLISIIIGVLNINFQIICSVLIFALILLILLFQNIKRLLYIILPLFVLAPLFTNYFQLFLLNLNLGPWVDNKNIYWFVSFLIANLGVPFLLFLIYLFLIVFKRISISTLTKLLLILFIGLIVIPLVATFTIDGADMLKFYYISYIPMSIFSAIVLRRISKKKYGILLVCFLIVASIFTGFIDLAGSRLNKNLGYTAADLDSGMWIRSNTNQKSNFVTSPTIHSPVSDIGGRLRVLSYTNWPYTHGFKDGDDSVFKRFDDVQLIYSNLDNENVVRSVSDKYNIDYIYIGSQELSDFPMAKNKLESNSQFKIVYDQNNIKIFQRVK